MFSLGNEKPGHLFWTTLSNSKWGQSLKAIGYESESLIGYGKSFSSFGEIVQGRLTNGEDFLVTLPIDLWSTCELICKPIKGPLVIECDFEKSRSLLYNIVEELGIKDCLHIECVFTRNIPIGKGLSSSTADMLAALRAIQEVFGLLIKESFISRLFATIEPHDGVHYNSSVAYNHRKGILLSNYEYIPKYVIIAVDNGGAVDTIQYNQEIIFSELQKEAFDQLYIDLQIAFDQKNDLLIAKCATRSAHLYSERSSSLFVRASLAEIANFSAIGMVVAHSGTCVGFLYPDDISFAEIERLIGYIKSIFNKQVFVVRTLNLLT